MNRPVCIALFFTLCSLLSSAYDMEVVNVVAYSSDPSEYKPTSYPCPKLVYNNALLACVNATTMPKNITFKAANCLEQNCKIEYPKPPQETEPMVAAPLWEAIRSMLMSNSPLLRSIRSVSDNSIDDSDKQPKMKIVQQVETYASRGRLEFGEPEYDG